MAHTWHAEVVGKIYEIVKSIDCSSKFNGTSWMDHKEKCANAENKFQHILRLCVLQSKLFYWFAQFRRSFKKQRKTKFETNPIYWLVPLLPLLVLLMCGNRLAFLRFTPLMWCIARPCALHCRSFQFACDAQFSLVISVLLRHANLHVQRIEKSKTITVHESSLHFFCLILARWCQVFRAHLLICYILFLRILLRWFVTSCNWWKSLNPICARSKVITTIYWFKR